MRPIAIANAAAAILLLSGTALAISPEPTDFPDPQIVALSGALQHEETYATNLLEMLKKAKSEIADLKKKCGERCAAAPKAEPAKAPPAPAGAKAKGAK